MNTGISEDNRIFAFSEILLKMEETNEKIVVPILKKIESNTSFLKKSSRSSREKIVIAEGAISRTAPLSQPRKKKSPETAAKISTATARRATLDDVKREIGPVRNNKGRFVSLKNSHAEDNIYGGNDNSNPEKRGRLATLAAFGVHMAKGGAGDKKGTIAEAVGRATMGPMFDAAMEMKDRYDQFKDAKDNLKGEYSKFKGNAPIQTAKVEKNKEKIDTRDAKGRFLTAEANTDDTDAIISSLQSSEKEDEQRHKELVAAILKADKEKSAGAKSGLPTLKETGPGATVREKAKKEARKPQLPTGAGLPGKTPKAPGAGGGGMFGKLGSMAMKIGPLLAALPLGTIAAGIAAVGAVGAAGYSAITGKDNFINQTFKAITGIDAGKTTQADIEKENAQNLANTKRVNAERRAQGKKELEFDPVTGMVKSGAVATAQESGKGGAGTISTGKNDAGGASYGKPQFASAGGDKSPVAQFVRQSSHAAEFKGLTPGTPEFNKKWREVDAKDKNFGNEQDAYRAKAMSAPVIAKAVKGGFNTDDVGIREALISQSINHGPGGNKKILAGAQADLASKYGSVEAAPVQDQIDAIYASRKSYVNQVAENKMATAQKLRAKGNEQGALKAEGEAKQLRSMAGTGGRYDQENAITKDLSLTGGIVSRAIAQKATVPVIEGEISRDKASEVTAKPEETAIATATRVTDARGSALAKKKASLAAAGVGSLEAQSISSQEASSAAAPPVATAIATGMPSRIKQPERINPEDAYSGKAGGMGIGKDAAAMNIPGMDGFMAMMSKFVSGQGEQSKGNTQQIRTEFDDTTLTLMAYDRI